jgi:hypothetical protein
MTQLNQFFLFLSLYEVNFDVSEIGAGCRIGMALYGESEYDTRQLRLRGIRVPRLRHILEDCMLSRMDLARE